MLSDPSIKKYCVSLEGLDDVILFSKNMKENIAPIIEVMQSSDLKRHW